MLAKAVQDRPFEWEDHLRRLCLAYNTSVNPTTGYTPFYLMFGRQVRMPVDIMYGSPNPPTTSVPQYVADLRSGLEAAYNQVRGSMSRKLSRQKEVYDQRAHGQPFKPGDFVWLHTPVIPRGHCKKLHNPWTGPYQVVKRLSEAVYRIQHMQARQKRLVVHFDRLKPCSPDIRPPMSTGSKRGATASSSATPPVVTDLELLEDPHEDLPRDIPAPGGVASSADSPTQPNVSEGGSVPLVFTSVPPPPQSFRYPRRARSQPYRYRPESSS